jgi:hypothetical protein
MQTKVTKFTRKEYTGRIETAYHKDGTLAHLRISIPHVDVDQAKVYNCNLVFTEALRNGVTSAEDLKRIPEGHPDPRVRKAINLVNQALHLLVRKEKGLRKRLKKRS